MPDTDSTPIEQVIGSRRAEEIGVQTKGIPMLQTMDQSSDTAIGYTVVGEVGEADYQTLVPAVQAAIDKSGSINMLLDLTQFKWEKVDAWKSDLDFGQTYKNKIDKMALVGNAKWERHLTKLAQPFYAKQTKYFESDDDAWDWLGSN
jgi:hypothetical protein